MTDTTYHRCSKFEPERPYLPSNEELMARRLEEALCDPLRDPVAEADGYRDTMPDDAADALSLARGEIAWLREAVRRLTIALEALSSPRSSTVDEATVGWQPIETAPKDGTRLLLWDTFSVFEGLYNGSAGWATIGLSSRPWVSCWQPLPEPPASLPSVAVQPIGEQ